MKFPWSPDENELNNWLTPDGFFASSKGDSGSIYFQNNNENSRRAEAFVTPSFSSRFTGITQGVSRNKFDVFSLLDEYGNPSLLTNVLYSTLKGFNYADSLNLLYSPFGGDCIAFVEREALREGEEKLSVTDDPDASLEKLKKKAGEWLMSLIIQHGSQGLEKMAKMSAKIEKKTRTLERQEEEFILCIKWCTEKLGSVPTKKDIKDEWLNLPGKTENSLTIIRKRLGFDWLPMAKRGGNAQN